MLTESEWDFIKSLIPSIMAMEGVIAKSEMKDEYFRMKDEWKKILRQVNGEVYLSSLLNKPPDEDDLSQSPL
jgi:hypothetical protein